MRLPRTAGGTVSARLSVSLSSNIPIPRRNYSYPSYVATLPNESNSIDALYSSKLVSRNRRRVLSTGQPCSSQRTSRFDSTKFAQRRRRRTSPAESSGKAEMSARRYIVLAISVCTIPVILYYGSIPRSNRPSSPTSEWAAFSSITTARSMRRTNTYRRCVHALWIFELCLMRALV